MKETPNGYYPTQFRQGSRRDFVGAWIMRLVGTVMAAAIIWICSLIYAGVVYLVSTLPSMQADVSSLKTDMTALKENVKNVQETAITKDEFNKTLEAKLKEFKVNKEGRLIVAP